VVLKENHMNEIKIHIKKFDTLLEL